MKNVLLTLLVIFSSFITHAQSCEEIMKFVKSSGYGTTLTNYNIEAISKVTFYNTVIDYQNYYFAIVCFKKNIH